MKLKSICKRCHRLKVVNRVGYCAGCDSALRTQEQPKKNPRREGSSGGGSS